MTLNDNAYASFMLDYAAGAQSPAERLVGDLHRVLSAEGGVNPGCWRRSAERCLKLAILAAARCGSRSPTLPQAGPAAPRQDLRLEPFLDRERLLALPWRKDLFGMKTLSAGLPLSGLLRLDPGERAPAHCHGRRDVTVVLTGSFADQFGVYERGDLAFAEPGIRHEPRAVGGESCVCLLATEPGKPTERFPWSVDEFRSGGANMSRQLQTSEAWASVASLVVRMLAHGSVPDHRSG